MRKIVFNTLVFLLLALLTTGCKQDKKPVITPNGDFVTEYTVYSPMPDFTKAVTVTDLTDGTLEVTSSAIDVSRVHLDELGQYDVIFTFTNSLGLSASYTLKISVVDNIGPVFVGLNDSMVLNLGSAEPDWLEGLSGMDNYDGLINGDHIAVDDSLVNLNVAGVYPLTFTVSDASGNLNVKTVNVTVRAFSTYEQFLSFLDEINNEFDLADSFRLESVTDLAVTYAPEMGLDPVTTATVSIVNVDKTDYYMESMMTLDGALISHSVIMPKDSEIINYALGELDGKKYVRPLSLGSTDDISFDDLVNSTLPSLSAASFTEQLTYSKISDNHYTVTGSINDYAIEGLTTLWEVMMLPEDLINSLVLTVDVAYDPLTGVITYSMDYDEFAYEGVFDALKLSMSFVIDSFNDITMIDPTGAEYIEIPVTLEEATELTDISHEIASPFFPGPDYYKVAFESGQYELISESVLPEDLEILDAEGNKVDLGSDWGQADLPGYRSFHISAGEYYLVVNNASFSIDGSYSLYLQRSYVDEISQKLTNVDAWMKDAGNYRLTKAYNEDSRYSSGSYHSNYTRYYTIFNNEIYYEMHNYWDDEFTGYYVLKETDGKVFCYRTEVKNAANYVTTDYICEESAFSAATLNDQPIFMLPVFSFPLQSGLTYTKLDENHYRIVGPFNPEDPSLAILLGVSEEWYVLDEAHFVIDLIFNPELKTFEMKSSVYDLHNTQEPGQIVDYTMNYKLDQYNEGEKLDMTGANFVYRVPNSIDTVTETTPITQPITSTEQANPHFYRVEFETGHYRFSADGINVFTNLKLYDASRNELNPGPLFAYEKTFAISAGTYYIEITYSEASAYSLEFTKLAYSDYGDLAQPEELPESGSGTLEGDYDMNIYHLASAQSGVLIVHYTVSAGSIKLYGYNTNSGEAGFQQNMPEGVQYFELVTGDNYLFVTGAVDGFSAYSFTYETRYDTNTTPEVLNDMIVLTDSYTSEYYLVGFNSGADYFRLDITVAGYYLIECESEFEATYDPWVAFYHSYNLEVSASHLRSDCRYLYPGTYYVKLDLDSRCFCYYRVKYSYHMDQTDIIPFTINDIGDMTQTDAMNHLSGTIMTPGSAILHEFTLAEESLVAFKWKFGRCEVLDQNNNVLSFYQDYESVEIYRLPAGTYRLRLTPSYDQSYPYPYDFYAGRVTGELTDDYMGITTIPVVVLGQGFTIIKDYAGDIEVFQMNVTTAGSYTIQSNGNFTFSYYDSNHVKRGGSSDNSSRTVYLNQGTYYFAFRQWSSVGSTAVIRIIEGA